MERSKDASLDCATSKSRRIKPMPPDAQVMHNRWVRISSENDGKELAWRIADRIQERFFVGNRVCQPTGGAHLEEVHTDEIAHAIQEVIGAIYAG